MHCAEVTIKETKMSNEPRQNAVWSWCRVHRDFVYFVLSINIFKDLSLILLAKLEVFDLLDWRSFWLCYALSVCALVVTFAGPILKRRLRRKS